MALIRAAAIVLDCADPEELSDFYRELLEAETLKDSTSDRIDIQTPSGIRIGFRRDLHATPTSWPRPEESLQAHLDFLVEQEDLDAVERHVVGLGGTPTRTQGHRGPHEARTYADPFGYSFTIRTVPHQGPKTD